MHLNDLAPCHLTDGRDSLILADEERVVVAFAIADLIADELAALFHIVVEHLILESTHLHTV